MAQAKRIWGNKSGGLSSSGNTGGGILAYLLARCRWRARAAAGRGAGMGGVPRLPATGDHISQRTRHGPSAGGLRDFIEEQLEKAGRVVDGAFSVAVEATGGYDENRRRVSEDEKGNLVGFAYDGFGDSENVATILPLDNRYLHILCPKGIR